MSTKFPFQSRSQNKNPNFKMHSTLRLVWFGNFSEYSDKEWMIGFHAGHILLHS